MYNEYSNSTHVFHNASTSTGNGTDYELNGEWGTLLIGITGSATSRTLSFQARSLSTDYVGISGTNITTLTNSTGTSSTSSEYYEFDVQNIHSFRVNLSAISGEVTVKGKARKI